MPSVTLEIWFVPDDSKSRFDNVNDLILDIQDIPNVTSVSRKNANSDWVSVTE